MKYPRYPKYKDSGLSWLPEVPVKWQIVRAKNLFKLAKRLPQESDGIVTAFRDGQVTLRSNRRIDGFTNAIKEIGYQRVCTGDLVIHAMDAFAGAVGVSESDGKCSPVYSCCIPNSEVSSQFYANLVRNMALTGFIESLAKGVRERSTDFRWNDFGVQPLPVPPYQEQLKINTFLTHETAKIDALIAEQEKLITLLREKRQAVISQAVTKGLNLDAPMKDSGVEWLGKVPKGWNITRLKFVTEYIIDCPHETPIYSEDGEYLVIRTADISAGCLDTSRIYRLEADEYRNRIRRRALSQGDIVYGREGERWGFAAVVPHDNLFCLGQRMMQFIPSCEINSLFLMWQLNSQAVYKQGAVDTVGATSPHVNVCTIKNYSLTLPPLSEQHAIIEFLETETAKIDSLITEAKKAVELLKERRSAVISAAVTGKIDVRDIPLQEAV